MKGHYCVHNLLLYTTLKNILAKSAALFHLYDYNIIMYEGEESELVSSVGLSKY